MITKIKTLILCCTVLALPINAADILKTDGFLKNKQFNLAEQGYLEAAKLGNPYAYYQLGTMKAQGLVGEKDMLNSLFYYSLAADYQFQNANKLVDKMLANTSPSQRTQLEKMIADFKLTYDKETIKKRYFPFIDTENLVNKVTFNGKETLDSVFHDDDFEEDIFTNSDEVLAGEDDLGLIMSTPKQPFIIVDIEVAADGSIRHVTEVQRIGYAKRLLDQFELFPLDIPSFKNNSIDFVHRVYLGAAGYSKFTLIDKNESLFHQIRKELKKLSTGETLSEQYSYAVAQLNFTAFKQEDELTSEQRLLAIAKKGHPGAMYEYGLKLYREQREIPQAIHWISEASKYGLTRAEYRLGKMLLSSPWIIHDEKKAMLWFESAMEKSHDQATIEVIKLKLIAQDKTLHDLAGAITYLEKIKASQARNPEYFYLLALSHQNRENRDFTQVVTNLRKAITMGQTMNWDVSEWQDLLSTLTTGVVYIVE